jgi:hypothetical protein
VEVADRLRELDVLNLTPLEALTELAGLQRRLRGEEEGGARAREGEGKQVTGGGGKKRRRGKDRPEGGGLDHLIP